MLVNAGVDRHTSRAYIPIHKPPAPPRSPSRPKDPYHKVGDDACPSHRAQTPHNRCEEAVHTAAGPVDGPVVRTTELTSTKILLPSEATPFIIYWLRQYFHAEPGKKLFGVCLTFHVPCKLSRKHILELEQFLETTFDSSPFARMPSLQSDSVSGILTVGVPTKKHDEEAARIEDHIQSQLWNSYEGFASHLGIWCHNPTQSNIQKRCGGIQLNQTEDCDCCKPDGALSIPEISQKPIIVIEVANSATYEATYQKCKDWGTYHSGLINFAILFKMYSWPRKKEGKDKGQRQQLRLNKRNFDAKTADGFNNGERCPHSHCHLWGQETADNDDAENIHGDVDGNAPSPTTHKYRRATVSIFGTERVDNKRRMRETDIQSLEVWPAKSSKTWRFTWRDILESEMKPELEGIEIEISLELLHDLMENTMRRKSTVVPARRGDPPEVETTPRRPMQRLMIDDVCSSPNSPAEALDDTFHRP
ncbi:hypothetical protein FN846DRAFT_896702 [Sphaerosporella brunnea]|uniref:Uncharacterized protein n=1 Tax=Sphaerosporella brunnea TaxID=1250544 RepID=A0A5J5EBI6_9PEZI|nr:hypothetical protein FN846DRAFT_896735 [Sphaerosporella brunnea]KAA8892597.1 hypothetical protein FN846DRAFT_896709 [Sphaerosporella brunnea]KAA8892603.1 hypothetical protein FN846DRAFT_896702 [Sphaerosporella brunnea]